MNKDSTTPAVQDVLPADEATCCGLPRWWMVAVAAALALLSTVSKVTLGPVEFSGGPMLAALAALVLLWPIVSRFADRGGSAELLGVKLQLNSLERLTEEAYAVRFQELRSDIEEIRQQIAVITKEGPSPVAIPRTEEDEHEFFAAVVEYRAHRDMGDWKARVAVDKRLATGAGRLPVVRFRHLLAESPDDQELAMAVASSLGTAYPGENDSETARLLAELLANPFERARYRAVRSIMRRAERSDTSVCAREVMADGVRTALRRKDVPAVYDSLLQAQAALEEPN